MDNLDYSSYKRKIDLEELEVGREILQNKRRN